MRGGPAGCPKKKRKKGKKGLFRVRVRVEKRQHYSAMFKRPLANPARGKWILEGEPSMTRAPSCMGRKNNGIGDIIYAKT